MITYVDTSVILRLAFNEPNHLVGWQQLPRPTTSRLARIESLRTLDRRMALGGLAAPDVANRRAFVLALLDAMDQVQLSDAIQERAENPFPTPLRTLDALHLATALALVGGEPVTMATHDDELAVAARAMGLRVIGA